MRKNGPLDGRVNYLPRRDGRRGNGSARRSHRMLLLVDVRRDGRRATSTTTTGRIRPSQRRTATRDVAAVGSWTSMPSSFYLFWVCVCMSVCHFSVPDPAFSSRSKSVRLRVRRTLSSAASTQHYGYEVASR
jgi:hypothetical protein